MNEAVFTIGNHGFGTYHAEIKSGQIHLEPAASTPKFILAPGFVDQHIHGSFGIDFMEASSDQIQIWADKLSELGYEGFVPTTVTSSAEAVLSAVGNLPADDIRILGFHLEGPFLSPLFPGAQPQDSITEIPQGPSEWDEVFDHPRLRVITLAPEIPGAANLISRLHQRDVRVGMGHTNALYKEAESAFRAGAGHSTHTFNAMRPFHHREAGVIGFCLDQSHFACELIYDRVHVCKESAMVLTQCKGSHGVIAVSDGTKASGMEEGTRLTMWGLDVVVGRSDVRLQSGALAGSSITLLDAFKNLANDFGPELAIRATSLNPRAYLGLKSKAKVYCLFTQSLDLVEVIRLDSDQN